MHGELAKVLPYGIGFVALVFVAIFLANAYFSELMKTLASSTPAAFRRLMAWLRPVGGRKLRNYRKSVVNRYSRHKLGFGEGNEGQPLNIRQVYIPLHSLAGERRADALQTLNQKRRSVLLGEPGAGKSLLLKNAMASWAEEGSDQTIPVMVDLHECNTTDVGLKQLVVNEFMLGKIRQADSFVDKALGEGRLCVFFDGLDEVGSVAHDRVVKELQSFAISYDACQIVVTCRNSAYREQLDEEFDQIVRLADFDDASIIRFLGKWPGISGNVLVAQIFRALQRDPELMGLARSPLMLTMIAYLQSDERVELVGPLPNSRSAFYDTAVTHMLDRDRRLGRTEAIGMYTAERKMLVLERVALKRMEDASAEGDRQEISRNQLLTAIRELLPGFDLGPEHAESLLNEIVARSQLIQPLDRLNRYYAFTHLTLLEYLAARALHDDPQRLMSSYRRTPEQWREIVRMWCAVARTDCTPVISDVFSSTEVRQKILSLQCLADAVHVNVDVADGIVDYFIRRIATGGLDGQAIIEGIAALAASSRPRGSRVLALLVAAANATIGPERSASLVALAASGRLEAAEVLATCASRLDGDEARAALQSMGEISLPALVSAAQRGGVWAVQSLGSVGTPAAAQELVNMIWADESRTAQTAAWTLASLLRNPDIEQSLRELSLASAHVDARAYSWVWSPFTSSEPRTSTIAPVAGRIAFLLDGGRLIGGRAREWDASVADGIEEIDRRIAIPVAALGLSRAIRGEIDLARAHQMAREAGRGFLSRPIFPRYAITQLLLSEQAASERAVSRLGPLVEELLSRFGAAPVYRRILFSLPWVVQLKLLAACVKSLSRFSEGVPRLTEDRIEHHPYSRPIEQSTWVRVMEIPPAPRVWERVTGWLSFAAIVTVLFVGTVRTIYSLAGWKFFGFEANGSANLNWVTVTVAALVGVSIALIASRTVPEAAEDHLAILLGFCFLFLAVRYIWITVGVVAVPLGWFQAIALVLLVTASIAFPGVIASRRKTARSNPLRPCLLASAAQRDAGQ
ncbi:NACHT domain-containing protein [Streptomyces mirabilis]|uniref:NACHT domain-containing protein n=1 Tax=Streptomyces mirabilis TaxID=68239 RepID=UPI00371CFDCF